MRDYWRRFRRRQWIVLVTLLLSTAIAILIALTATPMYRATATLIVEEIESGSVLKGLLHSPIPAQERFDLVKQRLMSHTLLMEVAEGLNLRDYLERKKGMKIADTGVMSTLKKNWFKLRERIHLRKPRTRLTDHEIVKYLRSIFSIRIRRANLIEISIVHSKPEMAQTIANQLAKTYVEYTKGRRVRGFSRHREFINELLAEAKKDLIERKEIGNMARVLDPAVLPQRPVKPNKLGIIANGVVLGIGIAFILLFMNPFVDWPKAQ
jgi:uncharacterized protein involved in exopolysaccharide biosynthesis